MVRARLVWSASLFLRGAVWRGMAWRVTHWYAVVQDGVICHGLTSDHAVACVPYDDFTVPASVKKHSSDSSGEEYAWEYTQYIYIYIYVLYIYIVNTMIPVYTYIYIYIYIYGYCAFIAPDQGLDCSFCHQIAWSRLSWNEFFFPYFFVFLFTDTGMQYAYNSHD